MKNIFESNYIKPVKQDNLSNLFNEMKINIKFFGDWENRVKKHTKNLMLSHYKLVFCEKGSVEIIIDDKKYISDEGNILIIPPYQLYSAAADKQEVKYYYFRFEIYPVYLSEKLRNEIIKNNNYIYNLKTNNNLKETINKLTYEYEHQKIGYAAKIKLLVEDLLLEIMRVDNNIKKMDISNKNLESKNLFNIVNDFLQKNLNEVINMESLCTHLNVSDSYLYKIFIKELGISPKKYIMLFKSQQAEYLLCNTNYQIQEIAEMLGYSSAYHFSSSFKKILHISPKEYRDKYSNF